jgi:multicomponent Na+:H+ antiporter subunit D
MTKIWAEVFWKPVAGHAENIPQGAMDDRRRAGLLVILPIASLALVTVLIGLGAPPVYVLARRAAEQLMDPAEYIHAVLGTKD